MAAQVDTAALAKELEGIRQIEPTMILSSHLPAVPGDMIDRLVAAVRAAPTAQPFVGPDQAALEQMLAQMTGGAPES